MKRVIEIHVDAGRIEYIKLEDGTILERAGWLYWHEVTSKPMTELWMDIREAHWEAIPILDEGVIRSDLLSFA